MLGWFLILITYTRTTHQITENTFLFSLLFWTLGIDGPAAFLKPDAQDLETKLHVLSVGSSATEEDTEESVDGESTLETVSKPDLQEILQKHGKDW